MSDAIVVLALSKSRSPSLGSGSPKTSVGGTGGGPGSTGSSKLPSASNSTVKRSSAAPASFEMIEHWRERSWRGSCTSASTLWNDCPETGTTPFTAMRRFATRKPVAFGLTKVGWQNR